MNDQTEHITRQDAREHATNSRVFNVSLRGWIALIITSTVCVMSIMALEVKEPLYTLAGMVIGFYFANSQQKQQKP